MGNKQTTTTTTTTTVPTTIATTTTTVPTTIPTTTTTIPTTPPPTTADAQNYGLTTMDKVVIGLSCAALIIMLATAIVYFIKRKRKKKLNSEEGLIQDSNRKSSLKLEDNMYANIDCVTQNPDNKPEVTYAEIQTSKRLKPKSIPSETTEYAEIALNKSKEATF
ncbi:probable inactive serine/threonine-protein kinase gdt6 [Acipenser ruthenus]|uniref:probable inactive serine/threonine-protein kinase gdt6 n=1 Tax=Acipenser ruthenus TaxID=7906 RepID=UPI00145A2EB5|nr:probable inactive serine/threonine-protein kinase gdt6 [Acipenser ruthenus]XP_058861045.1 probable inactive serine/threonine-protein kinase gdt6 [Acipenser ruthenus]